MRYIAALVLTLALVPACDDDSGTNATQDMAMHINHDMAVGVAADSCAAALVCAMKCKTPASYLSCVGACVSAASQTAQGYFAPIIQCTQDSCANADGGTVACTPDPTTSACQTCVQTSCASEIGMCAAH